MENPFEEIRTILERNEIREGLANLARLIPDTSKKLKHNVSTILARLKDLEDEYRTGVISRSDFLIERTKLIRDTLLLTDEVETPTEESQSSEQEKQPGKPKVSTIKDSVILENVQNEGGLTINNNRNKNVIQVVLIVIALMLIGGYFLWPELSVYFSSEDDTTGKYSVVSKSYIIDKSSTKIRPLFYRIDFMSNGLANIYPTISLDQNPELVQTRKYTESDDVVLLDLPLVDMSFTKLENKNIQGSYWGISFLYLKVD